MPDHFREYVRHRGSPGLILVPQELSIGRAIESILLISEACAEHDLANRVCLVPSLVIYGFSETNAGNPSSLEFSFSVEV